MIFLYFNLLLFGNTPRFWYLDGINKGSVPFVHIGILNYSSEILKIMVF